MIWDFFVAPISPVPNYWVGGVGHNWGKYCIGLFHVSGHLEQFGGVLFFGGKINYFGGKG